MAVKAKGKHELVLSAEVDKNYVGHSNQLAVNYKQAKGVFDAAETTVDGDTLNPIVGEDDVVQFPFRHLSATIVGAGTWKATDFSDVKVLKAGTKLLNEKPVYLNHMMYVGNEVGYVDNAVFTEAYTNKAGVKIPAGIDAPVNIDSKLYPDIVRKMSGKVPYIKSASVTVKFEWEASHEFERENDFYYHIGEMIDGSMVRRIVTKITDFYESSLVWLGADPYAGILDEDGEVKFVDKGGIVGFSKGISSNAEKFYHTNNKYFLQFCLRDENFVGLKIDNQKLKDNDMKEIIAMLAVMLGVTEDKVTKEMLEAHSFVKKEEFDALKLDADKGKEVVALKASIADKETEITSLKTAKETAEGKVSGLETEIATLKKEKGDLETEKTSFVKKAEIADNVIKSRQEYAKELYTKSLNGADADPIILKEIEEEVSLEKLESKVKLHGGKALSTFKAHCKKCASEEIEFKSSVTTEGNKKDPKESNDGNDFIENVLSK